jgi:hypothetical protein
VAREVVFEDAASGKEVRLEVAPGRAALRLVGRQGEILARYDPIPVQTEDR